MMIKNYKNKIYLYKLQMLIVNLISKYVDNQEFIAIHNYIYLRENKWYNILNTMIVVLLQWITLLEKL